ncbi:MAG TPA: Ldh family oxidoreductase [Chloroflexota bacterium]|nr:Ldh family oxidoreductase [Chloroflexota bacterium]
MVVLSADAERCLISDVLTALHVPPAGAASVADDLVEADLRGHDSHGLGRLNMQVDNLRAGRVDAAAQPRLVHEQAGAIVVDGCRALGPPTIDFALDLAAEHAQQHGSCTAAIRNHGYIAYLGRYVERTLERDCICILLGKSKGNVHPWGGLLPLVGSNPIAAAIPTEDEPLLVDMSTGTAAMGKILEAIRTGEGIPSNWAVDEQGRPTSDPLAARRGALSPLGGAKGYALGLLVELLAAVLPGGDSGSRRQDANLWSALAIVLHVPSFAEPAAFRRQTSAFLESLKESPKAPGFDEILVPGERTYRTRRERLQSGIPHPDETWRSASAYCRDLNLEPGRYLSPTSAS